MGRQAQGAQAQSWQPQPTAGHGQPAASRAGASTTRPAGTLPRPGTMKQQVFWTGLEYTCRLLGITTAAGKTLPPPPAPAHGAQHTGLPKGRAPAMGGGQKHLATSSPSSPKPQKRSSGQWQLQWVSLGLGSRVTVQNPGLATRHPWDFGNPQHCHL